MGKGQFKLSSSPTPTNPQIKKTSPLLLQSKHQVTHALPLFHLLTTYLSYVILILIGHIKDFIIYNLHSDKLAHLKVTNGYAPINSGFDTFYHRNLYYRIRDVFNRPVTGIPGRVINILERVSNDYNATFTYSGKTRQVLNLSSYNYLGFGEGSGKCCDAVEACVRRYGVTTCSTRSESGTLDLHLSTENLVARFMGQESAIVCSMGFATNSTMIPALIGKGGLIISDELNHSSLIAGARVSGASVKVFKHNDPKDLEKVVREAIARGHPTTHRPWKKILLVVEGLYSMEGNICRLPEILEIKKKYKLFMYLDEAHSVGAMGPNGRGICDYYGIDPSDIDVLMGTFTKSFGAAGGYIAGKKLLIDTLRLKSHSNVYAESISVPVIKQIYASMRMIMGEDGGDGRHRIQTLARNSRYFADELRKMGFIVYGNDSPVIPLLLMNPAKIPAFSREMLKRGIAVVVVGYPATPIITSRVRFCISAAHTIEDLDFALGHISEVGDLLMLKMAGGISRVGNRSARVERLRAYPEMKPTKYDIADSNIAGLGTDLEKQVKLKAAQTEAAWKNVGSQVGTQVWRIENFCVVAVNPKDYGMFYEGDSYIILNTFKKPDEPKLYHSAHFWLGAETTQDEAGTAAYKTVELDDFLHGAAIQYRELQGSESRLLLSYFSKFQTIKGGVDSGFNKVGPKEYKPRFFHVQSVNKTLSVTQVDADVANMNDGDVFVLDKGLLIYQMNMSKSAGTERNKAAAFSREISADRGGSKVIVYDQGDEAKEFWENVKGDKSTIGPAKVVSKPEPATKVLAKVSDSTGSLSVTELARGPTLARSLLTSDDVFILNTGAGQIYAWIGKNASTQERKMGLQVASNYVKQNKLGSIGVCRVVEGGEPSEFLQVFS